MKSRLIILTSLFFCYLFIFSPIAQSIVPVKKEQLIYGLSAFSGEDYLGRYRDIFCPQSENTIYVIANYNNVIYPTYSLVYFWPDKGVFFADRVSLNKPVGGKLEILKNGNVINNLDKIEFSYFLPEGRYSTKTEIVVGKKAEVEYKRFQKAEIERQILTNKFQQKMKEYEGKKEELQEKILRKENLQGEKPLVPPQIPPELKEDIFYVTEPMEAYLINVEKGSYQIGIRTIEGKIVEGSEKNLVAINPRMKGGIGYNLIPEAKYSSHREYTHNRSEYIYFTDNNIFYLKPYSQEKYNELAYEKAKDPQNKGDEERWEWVRIKPREGIALQLYKKGKLIKEITEKAYFVKSIPGATYSYTILEYEEGKMPYSHFSGFKFDLNPKERGNYRIKAVDINSSEVIKTGERKIVFPQTVNDWLLYSPVILPILVGFLAFAWKKKKR